MLPNLDLARVWEGRKEGPLWHCGAGFSSFISFSELIACWPVGSVCVVSLPAILSRLLELVTSVSIGELLACKCVCWFM
jgi:hypothetical protein